MERQQPCAFYRSGIRTAAGGLSLTSVNFEENLPGLGPRQKPAFPLTCSLIRSPDDSVCISPKVCAEFAKVFMERQSQLVIDEEYVQQELIPRSGVCRQATKSIPSNWRDIHRCKRCLFFTFNTDFSLYFTNEMKKYDSWMALCASCVRVTIHHDTVMKKIETKQLRLDEYIAFGRSHGGWHACMGSSRDCVVVQWRSAVIVQDHDNYKICALCADDYEAQTRQRHWDQQARSVLLSDTNLVVDVVQLIGTFFLGRHSLSM